MFRIIVLFTAAGLAWVLSNCKVLGQVTHPDGRQNQSVCLYTHEGSNMMMIWSKMTLNRESCLTLESVEVHVIVFNENTDVRLVACLTFGDWPTKSPGVVNKESLRTFDLKNVSLNCAVHNLNTSSTNRGHSVVHSELKFAIDDQNASWKQLPFKELIFMIICLDIHESKLRYPAACPIANDTRENQTKSLSTASVWKSEGLRVTDFRSPSTAVEGLASQSLDNLTSSGNVSDEKKQTERRLGWYFFLLAIIVSLLLWLSILFMSRGAFKR